MFRLIVCCLLLAAAPARAAESDVHLRLHGSNTLGSRLAPALLMAYARAEGFADVRQEETAPLEFRVRGRREDGRSFIGEVHAHGTNTGFANLNDGKADVWMASRAASADEAERARRIGDLHDPGQEHVVGLDGLAIIVHEDNPVRELSLAQIRDAFAGRLRNWSQLGGPDRPIRLHGRDSQSGTFDSFQSMVLGKQAQISPDARRYESSSKLESDVADDPDALGFVGFSYLKRARALAVFDGGSLALAPDALNVATEDYLLARRLYFYTGGEASPELRAFIEFVLGPQGQEVVTASAFVAQNIFVARAEPFQGNPDHYYDVVSNAERLSVNLRFRPQSSALDSRALRDIERLAEFMGRPENRGKQLRLAAFGVQTPTASPVMTLFTVNDRVDHVATLLSTKGVQVGMGRGFVGGRPLAPLDRPDGRARNERVEVWLYSPNLRRPG